MKEIFKDIAGYENLYQISNWGNVYGKFRHKPLHKNTTHAGYLQVTLCKNGVHKSLLIHRLVAAHFVKNPDNHKQVNHEDTDKQNNHYTNLKWCTQKYNVNHYIKAGLRDRRGEKAPMAKLKNENIPLIRSLYHQL